MPRRIRRQTAEDRRRVFCPPSSVLRPLSAVLCLLFSVLCLPARAENAYCSDLRAQIASAGQSPEAARYRAAAGKQQSEIDRTIAYARSIGCESRQFLFFGSPPPPQCGQINARIGRMRANLVSLERGTGEDQRQALIARYDAQCREKRFLPARRSRNFIEELFGLTAPGEGGFFREAPIEDPDNRFSVLPEDENGRPHGGSMAICVRACDGGFFPVSYSARSSNLDQLADLCKALCPNAETTLYTRSPYRDLETAVSIDGEPYSDHPNALKFQKTFDPACACKAPDKTWVETLADAERMLATNHGDDVVVTEEKAAELSRPLRRETRTSGKASKNVDADAISPSAKAPGLAPTEPIGSGKSDDPSAAGLDQGVTREVVGPDGAKRRVRVIAPAL